MVFKEKNFWVIIALFAAEIPPTGGEGALHGAARAAAIAAPAVEGRPAQPLGPLVNRDSNMGHFFSFATYPFKQFFFYDKLSENEKVI
jgi:hypothetical protein